MVFRIHLGAQDSFIAALRYALQEKGITLPMIQINREDNVMGTIEIPDEYIAKLSEEEIEELKSM